MGCYLLREVFNSLRIRINNTLEQKVLVDLRGDLHSRLLDLPVGYYDKRQTGEIELMLRTPSLALGMLWHRLRDAF